MELRAARAEDLDAILALTDAVAGEGMWIGHETPLDHDALRAGILKGLLSEAEQHTVAVAAGDIVGYLGATDQRGRVSFGMFVAARARGRGIGRALVRSLHGWACARAAHKIHLEVWPHNAAAISLYASEGFSVEGRRVRQYRRRNGELWDSLIMGLVIDETAPGSPHADAPVPAPTRAS